MQPTLAVLSAISFICLVITLLNLYGLTQTLRYKYFDSTPDSLFRFGRECPLPYKEALAQINSVLKIESPSAFAEAATVLVSKCIAHLEWMKLDPIKSNQIVPAWENPTLWLLGHISGLPYYQRYHFTYYKRTIERGFGVCGDAAMVLSQLLDKKKIEHRIVHFDGHVAVEAIIGEKKHALDPDFGVFSNYSFLELSKDEHLTIEHYRDAGYPESDGKLMYRIFNNKRIDYQGVFGFVRKRAILERISYWLFWYLPPIIGAVSLYLM